MCIYIYIHINVSLDQYSFTRTSTNLVPTYMAREHAIVMVVVVRTSTPHLLMMKILGWVSTYQCCIHITIIVYQTGRGMKSSKNWSDRCGKGYCIIKVGYDIGKLWVLFFKTKYKYGNGIKILSPNIGNMYLGRFVLWQGIRFTHTILVCSDIPLLYTKAYTLG